MKNKLGRKSMSEWMKSMQATTVNLYTEAFQAGYDAAKDETPDVEDVAKLLGDRYTDEELSEMLLILDSGLAPKRVKSPNQQRAELIQRAREFVEGKLFEGWDGVGKVIEHHARHNKVEFIVNKEKRTVVAIVKYAYVVGILSKGIAKCMPNEVFNIDIGKAIALARALEIDVPKEFVQAVQPDEVVVGMVIRRNFVGNYGTYERTVKTVSDDGSMLYTCGGGDSWVSQSDKLKIIDDSNAKYEVTT